MTSVQTILKAIWPDSIPSERYNVLPEIQQKAQELINLADGWTAEEIDRRSFRTSPPEKLSEEFAEDEPEGLEALFADLNNPPIGQEFVEHNHYETVYDISEEPAKNAIEPNSVSHPEFRPKHLTQATPESVTITTQIIEMRDDQKLTWKEIAKSVGLTEEAARKRYRAWKKKEQPKSPEPLKNLIIVKTSPPKDHDEIDEYIIDCRSKSWLDHEIAQGIERNFSQTWTAQKVGDRIREMLRRSV